jgi:carbohydrate diacid regulator
MHDEAAAHSIDASSESSGIPKLEGKLYEVALRVSAELPSIVDEVYALVIESDEVYARLPATIKSDLHTHMTFSGALWFRTLLTGEDFTPQDKATIADAARRRANQGIPLSFVLGGFRAGSLSMWRAFLRRAGDDREVRDGLLFIVSPYLLQYFDKLAQGTSTAYLEEQYRRARWREALRYELISCVFRFPDDEAGFRKTCEALSIDPTASHVAAVMEISMPDVPQTHVEHELDQLLLAVAQNVRADANGLVRTVHRGCLVVWIPSVRGDSVLVTDGLMRKRVQALANAIPEIRRIGVGLANAGAAGWATSMEEGFKALDNGYPIQECEACFMYSDVALYESVLKSDNALRYLDSIIERLTHEPYLLQTLAAYFEHGQHQKRAAAALKVHPNTLNYRLSRIEEVLGASLSDANWVARLAVVVRLRGL